MLKADLHLHSNYIQKRGEGSLSPKEIIDLYAKNNFDVLSITEHASTFYDNRLVYYKHALKTYHDFKDYAKSKGILLIPGFEMFVEGKEVLILNYTKDFTKLKKLKDLKKIKDKNVLIVAPHPYYRLKQCLNEKLVENINLFDAIEYAHVYLKFFNKYNEKALETARKYKKTIIGNSDGHHKFQMNTTYTFIDSKKDINSVIKAIKQNKVKLYTKPLSLFKFSRILVMLFKSFIKKKVLKQF